MQEGIALEPIGSELRMPLPTLGVKTLFPEAAGFFCTKKAKVSSHGEEVLELQV